MELIGRSHLKVLQYNDLWALVEATCPSCKQPRKLQVRTEELKAWAGGMLIQTALPTLSKTAREQLITGTCQPCWDAMWAHDDEEEVGPVGALAMEH